jgi:DNA-binding MarR family transcriptional regulator
MEVVGRLMECALVINRDRLHPLFAEHGLQTGEFDVLATLRRSGEPYALTPTALYEVLMISSGGMTSRIDRLEKAGLIERRKHPTDRRGTLVAMTLAGKHLIDGLIEQHVENERVVLSPLSKAEQEQLNALLAKILGGLSAGGPAG